MPVNKNLIKDYYLKYVRMLTRAEKIGQSVKYLPCKNKYLSLMPRTHGKKSDMVMQPHVHVEAHERTISKTKPKKWGSGTG